jgi:hypothetical protein
MVPMKRASEGRAVLAAQRLFRAAGWSNVAVTVPAFVAYRRYVGAFANEPPNYPFLVHIWSGMALLWGVSFFEVARDPGAGHRLMKYAALEKAVTTACVAQAGARREVPARVVAFVSLTDLAWIPFFVWTQRRLAPLARD